MSLKRRNLGARVLVFLPTYNERENIRTLIEHILRIVPDGQVLVVDDVSPDGTGEIVEEMRRTDHRVSIVHREGTRGRGLAGIEGLRRAGVRTDIDYVVEMDADGSHDPEFIPQLVEAAKTADLVLGSRYVEGGRVIGWGWFRLLNSAVANRSARLMLGLPFRDATSGFRCFRRTVLADLPWERMVSDNPSIVEEILYHVHRKGYSIKEIPIVFVDRAKGKSKFSVLLVGRWLWNLWCVRRAAGTSSNSRAKGNDR
jgi:dolichol-phosphate mannosyltransferase